MAAVFIAVLNSKMPKMFSFYVPSAAIQAELPESSLTDLLAAIVQETSSAMDDVPGMNTSIQLAVSQALSDAYAAAYAYVYYAAVAVGGVGLIATICMKDYDKLFTSHVLRTIGKEPQVPAARSGWENQGLKEKV